MASRCFPNGHLLLFRADSEPQKHHMIQLRQTPFHQPGYEPPGRATRFSIRSATSEVVRCLAECNEVLTLVRRKDPYAELYTDLVKRCGAILDSYPWLSTRMASPSTPPCARCARRPTSAVDEFDRVRRLQREAVERVKDAASARMRHDQFQEIRRASFSVLNDYVAQPRRPARLRGELITLREVRYVDTAAGRGA
jgi:hypothetical protein